MVEVRLPIRESGHLAATPAPSAYVLLAANLFPLYGVFFLGWEVFALLALFWMENVIIGVLNVARMLIVEPTQPVMWLRKVIFVPFFCVHYGLFTGLHGAFVFSGIFGGPGYGKGGLDVPGAALRALWDLGLWLPAAILAASHAFSFFWNYLYRGEYRRATLLGLMGRPYIRVVILHLTIIFGGIAAMKLGSPAWTLLLLIAIKIAIDMAVHRFEHRVAS